MGYSRMKVFASTFTQTAKLSRMKVFARLFQKAAGSKGSALGRARRREILISPFFLVLFLAAT